MKNTPYTACLFDYGNTLIEFDRPQISQILRRLAEELSRRFSPVTEAELQPVMNHIYQLPFQGPAPTYREIPPVEQMKILLDDLYGPATRAPQAVADADHALQEIFVETVTMNPDDVELLKRLSGHLPVGLVSNYPCGKAIRRTMARLRIEGMFETVVISGEVGFVKPHPRMFEEAVGALDVEPGEILFVGDRWDADLCGARDAGLHTCHMIGFIPEEDFQDRYRIYRPDHVARTLKDVAGILGLGGLDTPG